MDYTVVVPAYNCENWLIQLLADIKQTCRDNLPKEIIVVDDGSTDSTSFFAPIYTTRDLPIRNISVPHAGPLFAVEAGLRSVNTEAAIVCHADIRLRGDREEDKRETWKPVFFGGLKFRDMATKKVKTDVLSALVFYLENFGENVGIVAPYTLAVENPMRILSGQRVWGDAVVPFSPQERFNFEPLRKTLQLRNTPQFAVRDFCYAIRMNAFQQVGGFDKGFVPYFLYFDDFCTSVREKGWQIWLTTDVVVYHRANTQRPPKPEGSLTVMTPEIHSKNMGLFRKKWCDEEERPGPLWQRSAISYGSVIDDWTGR